MPPRRKQSDPHAEHDDPAFSALSLALQRRIDRAFDNARNSTAGPPRKRRKLNGDSVGSGGSVLSPAPGGFIVDDPQPGGFVVEEDIQPGGFVAEDSQPGGFVAEDDIQSGGFVLDADECEDVYMDSIAESASTNQDENWIPLSLIPHALQLLDLQPDDEDVLGVFRHAASGWEDKSRSTARSDTPDEQYVSRKDWRAVCAALLDTAVGDEEDLPPQSKQASDEGRDLTPLESSESGDEYQGSEPESESSGGGDDASDDEYQEGGFMTTDTKGKKSLKSAPTRTRTSRKSKRSLSAPDDDSDDDNQGTRPLTARQRLECRRAFALFFPSIPDAQLDKQRIMIKDITRVAKLLKEKMTADETVDMLEMFSTSADKSMSLPDFEQMMMAAKLA